MPFQRFKFVLLVLSVLLTPIAAGQEAAATIQITPFFGGWYKTGQWLPIHVTVTNDGPDRQATVRVGAAAGASYDTPIELPRGSRKAVVVFVRPENFAPNLTARLLEGERELSRVDFKVNAWPSRTQVIGLLAARPLTAPQPTGKLRQSKPTLVSLTLNDLPPRAEGWTSFDALIVDGVALDGLTPEQATALDDWVRAGGTIIVGSSEDASTLATLPSALRVTTPGPMAEVGVANTILAELGPDARIQATANAPTEGAIAIDALTVQKEWGRGRVTALGFSLSDPALQGLPPETSLWPTLIPPRLIDPNVAPDLPSEDLQAQQIAQALFNLPVLTLPPLHILVALLAVYILLIGPGLYFALRLLDRQVWAWVAIPTLTLLFSAATYGYGLRIRGDDIILNQISIVQPLGDRARVRTYAGVFSPTSSSYDIAVGEEALTRPLQFDPRMWGGQGGQPAKGIYGQGSNGIQDLAVGQWSMSTFAAEARLRLTTLRGEITLGDRMLRGVVRNEGTTPIRDVALIQANRAAVIGDLAPGEEKTVELRLEGDGGMNGEPLSMQIFKGRWNPNLPQPPELRLPIQIIDSMYGYAPATRPTGPVLIGWLDSNPLNLQVLSGRVQYQQLAMVEAPVELDYEDAVMFPRNWNRPQIETAKPEEPACMTQWGVGAPLTSGVVTATVQLDPKVSALQVTHAEIFTQVEGIAPGRVVIEAYDWQAGSWAPQSEGLGTADLSEPARFFQGRQMRIRVNLPEAVPQGGCIHIDSAIGGEL